jgi:hypothetical protein
VPEVAGGGFSHTLCNTLEVKDHITIHQRKAVGFVHVCITKEGAGI